MPSKNYLERGFKSRAEEMGIYYRQQLSISKFDPLDAFELAKHLQIEVFTLNEIFISNPDNAHFKHLSEPSNFSATWMPNSDGDKIIIHNTSHSSYRQQSNIMHELSHIILGHEIPEEYARLAAQFGLICYDPKAEQEAKYLGGCLQITRPGLQWAIKRFNHDEISKYYSASMEMVRYRLGVTGVERQYYRR